MLKRENITDKNTRRYKTAIFGPLTNIVTQADAPAQSNDIMLIFIYLLVLLEYTDHLFYPFFKV